MAKTFVAFGDIHWDSRDETAVAVLESTLRRLRPHVSVCLGDLVDATPFSRHARAKVSEMDARDWGEYELKPASRFLDRVQQSTREKTIFIEGNHDAWVERWAANAGIGGVSVHSLISPRAHLSRGRTAFRWIPWVDEWMNRNSYAVLHSRLIAAHGWCANKHAASKHLDMAKPRSIIYGHTHRQDRSTDRNPYTGELIEAIGAGCLCKLQPLYRHGGAPTHWTQGFIVGYLGKKSYQAYPVTIEKGSAILPCGKEIKAA